MKAVIPVAGAGTNLRPHTYTQHKALIPLAGKPILSHIIEQLEDAGITEFVFIIGYLGDKIKEHVQEKHGNIKSVFIVQENRRGVADAMRLTQDVVGGEQILIVLGDTITEYNVKEIISQKGNFVGISKVDNPSQFGIVEKNAEGKVIKFEEKPKIPHSNLAMIGVYKIECTPQMFTAIYKVFANESPEDTEFSFPTVLEEMRIQGCIFQTFNVKRWFDCGKKESILETNKILLQKLYDAKGIKEKVFDNTIIIQPVVIGDNTKIANSIIGPYVSIGQNVNISNSIISNSIIGVFTTIDKIVLESSLIGSDVIIYGNNNQLNIGDNTEIDLS